MKHIEIPLHQRFPKLEAIVEPKCKTSMIGFGKLIAVTLSPTMV
jgi:hypothetical protein